jgi:hypothetical protein
MVGAGSPVSQLPAELARPDAKVRYWDESAQAWSDRPLTPKGVVGPEVSALRALADRLGGRVLGVKVAVGGSSLATDWDPSRADGLYAQLRSTVSDALVTRVAGQGPPHVAAFFWMQGETDGEDAATASAYRDNLNRLINRVRTDFGDDRLPIVLGRVRANEPFASVVRQALDDVGKSVPRAETVNTDDLSLSDALHFDTKGTVALGRRFAEAYLRLKG